ncbi:AAA family ATPase [Desulfogranum mediterraneum]|uniref:AAA family ATPase n=1 Tax=Desulfogranum mediterraneum TaxID=160661 RepID=UPI0004216203|nr:MoxR family ATPase [Desulfogranum mediterraneum]
MTPLEEIHQLVQSIQQRIIGQDQLIQRLLIALLADGHLLVEGAPGLAKTRAVRILSHSIEGDFHRIQFTPDLLPADLTGTDIFRPQDGSFTFQKGPLFHNLMLADEINRAPAKVQSALLEAMAERQITVGTTTYPLAPLFLVMATQNPIEQEGTYPLPEAQLDRFLLHIKVDYPDLPSGKAILRLAREEARSTSATAPALEYPPLSQETIFTARDQILDTHMTEELEEYILCLIQATHPNRGNDRETSRWIQYGASPRGAIGLDRCSRALAWLNGRDFVIPEDIREMAPDILRHRLLLSFEAEAEGITPDLVIDRLLQQTPIP